MLHDHSNPPACCLPALLLRTSREPDHQHVIPAIHHPPHLSLLFASTRCLTTLSISIPCYPFTVNTSLTTSSLRSVSAFGSHRAKIMTPSKPWTHTVIKLRSQFHLNLEFTAQTKDKEHKFIFQLKHWGRHWVTANLAHLRGTLLPKLWYKIVFKCSEWMKWNLILNLCILILTVQFLKLKWKQSL